MMKLLNWISGIIIILWLAPSACLERIEPGKIGVRRSLSGGVSEADFRVGYHLSLPFWHSWYQLDGTLHYLEFNQSSPVGSLELRTKENNIIFIDLIASAGRGAMTEVWRAVHRRFHAVVDRPPEARLTGRPARRQECRQHFHCPAAPTVFVPG